MKTNNIIRLKELFSFLIFTSISSVVLSQNEVNLSVGTHFGGGIIFSLDYSGKHGLIAAPNDQSNGTCWGIEGQTNAIYLDDGRLNTERILSFFKEKKRSSCTNPAPCLCDSLSLGGFTDWYLPSIDELTTLNLNRKIVGGFIIGFYCSSTEYDQANFWSVRFDPKIKRISYQTSKLSKGYSVRCIRKF